LLFKPKQDKYVNNKNGFVSGDMDAGAAKKPGTLYVVATPIGNLEDITLRALRILKDADLIAAEDTRHTRILLRAHNIDTPLVSLHEHNEKERSVRILARIRGGRTVAYVSDAGTPCISDPGHHLVCAALAERIPVVPVPGACALVAALSASGFPADAFMFCGFLPAKGNQRRRFLETLRNVETTLVFYESPSRIAAAVQDMCDILGDREMVVARELTKVFEEIARGRASEILSRMSEAKSRGEFTVILEPVKQKSVFPADEDLRNELLRLVDEKSLSLRDAVALVAERVGMPRKKVYAIALKICRNSDS
jgi:16S rRNA (cytidine1402-2'-O)-methyltransferase